jgi:uncharacterized membrane protein YsdA (DUF1294 family)
MTALPWWVFWVVAFASLLTFVLALTDKHRARRGRQRIPERTLLAGAALGGSPGLVLGMIVSRHKVRKSSFITKLAVILFLQIAAVAAFVLR